MNNYLSLLLATFSLFNLTIILLGTLVGAVVGALPGFTATMAIAILILITYTWDASAALIFLGAIGLNLDYPINTLRRCRCGNDYRWLYQKDDLKKP